MFTDEIAVAMSGVPGFLGVYPADQFPIHFAAKSDRPQTMIINSETSKSPGAHWLGLAVHPLQARVTYFDSYALPPAAVLSPAGLSRLEQISANKWLETSPFPIQSSPTFENFIDGEGQCGEFCIFVLCKLPYYSNCLSALMRSEFIPTNHLFNKNKVKRYLKRGGCNPLHSPG